MFSWLHRRPKKNCQDKEEVGDKAQKSTIEEEPAPPTETPKEKTKKSWWRRLLRRKKKQKQQVLVEEDVKDDTQTATEKSSININKEEDEACVQMENADEGTETRPPLESPDINSDDSEEKSSIGNDPPTKESTPVGQGGSLQAETANADLWRRLFHRQNKHMRRANLVRTAGISSKMLASLGFPNLAQTCYMNSTLQGLLTLRGFVHDIYKQKEVWSSQPRADLMRRFIDVAISQFYKNKKGTENLLAAFKRAVAECNSEFEDHQQKDAHELLSSLLNQMRSLTPDLQASADSMGLKYTCPVDANIAFQMTSIRTCKGCGDESMREQDYIDLSLDLVHGGSVNQCLEEYFKENQLEYRCQCGAEESVQRAFFSTLPNVLIIQLKRFSFTETFNIVKMQSPVVLSRELLVNPQSSLTAQATSYSLVSIVSHLGSTADSGHYLCDGVFRHQRPGHNTDSWLTYNDRLVSETTGAAVCDERQRTAYLLFYLKKQ